jgi:hypothetical protein
MLRTNGNFQEGRFLAPHEINPHIPLIYTEPANKKRSVREKAICVPRGTKSEKTSLRAASDSERLARPEVKKP